MSFTTEQIGYVAADEATSRDLARDRVCVLRQRFDELIWRSLNLRHQNPEVRRFLKANTRVTENIALDVTNSAAVVYDTGAQRTLKKARKGQAEAFQKMMQASRIETLASTINRLAWFTGPVLEVPTVLNGKPSRIVLTYDQYEHEVPVDDPLGDPIKASWFWWDPDVSGDSKRVRVELDAEAYRYYRINDDRPYRVFPHGVVDEDGDPAFPGTCWRLDDPVDPFDWSHRDMHRRLMHATIEAAIVDVHMVWVRKVQNRKVASFLGELSALVKGQLLDVEVPVTADVPRDVRLPDFRVQDFNTPPKDFIEHIGHLRASQYRAYGLPVPVGPGQASPTPQTLAQEFERMSQVRNQQKPFMRRSEGQSHWKLAAVCKAHGLALAEPLDVKRIRENFHLEIFEPNRAADPAEFRKHFDWELRHGQKSRIDLYLRNHPDLDRETAEDRITENLNEEARLIEPITKRNQQAAGALVEDPAQTTGREGGSMSRRPAPDGEDEDSDE